MKIQLYSKEHLPPHFHAVLAEHRAQIEIATMSVVNGSLPPAKLRLVLDWARDRQQALMAAWNDVQANRSPEKIV